ncbi:MAG: hypothetical protein K6U80_13990 [Firmicutes bacterium]|nr:hypothetical protein [Bacillota bacterium]
MKKYDVIVIGLNLNGLVTASLLAKKGIQTLVVKHKGEDFLVNHAPLIYSWDCSKGAMNYVLNELGIREKIKMKRPQYVDRIVSSTLTIERPWGWDAYFDFMVKEFPEEKDHLNFYFQEMKELGEEWVRILQTGSIFQAKNINKLIKYYNTKYEDFVFKLFRSMALKNILLMNTPREEVALPVMAGYLVTQIFDFHRIEGGYSKICQVLNESFLNFGGVVECEDTVEQIQRIDSDRFLIRCENKGPFEGKRIVSTYDELLMLKHYFPGFERRDQLSYDANKIKPVTPLTIVLKMKEGFNFEAISEGFALYIIEDNKNWSFLKTNDNYQFKFIIRVYPQPEQKRIILQVDINVDYNNINQNVLRELTGFMVEKINEINPIVSFIEEENIFLPNQIEQLTGYYKGFFWRWAFKAEEMAANPFEIETPISGVFTTGQWGGAWFTSAIVAARNVLKSLQ